MMKKIISIFLVIPIILSGCATITGPAVSREEIDRAREEFKVKALAYQIKQLQRLQEIGSRLMAAIPAEDIKQNPQPFLGITCSQIDKYLAKVYNLSVQKGVVIIGVRDKSPAHNIGLQPADVLVAFNKTAIANFSRYQAVASRFKIGQLVEIEILRGSQQLIFNTSIGHIPLNLPIIMVDDQQVNAATNGKLIVVTYGLVNFAKSDDEIAAVLGHELAHAVRGHVTKAQGGQILTFLAALALGIAAESQSPGSGEGVMRGVSQIGNIFSATYSRDLEREADYFGAKFVYYSGYDVDTCATVEERFAIEMPATMVESYLSTHPSSHERVVRVRKAIEELKAGKTIPQQAR
ncbi:MAG: M48 family metallopeptidase [Candidatus Omnitrophota bacterium]